MQKLRNSFLIFFGLLLVALGKTDSQLAQRFGHKEYFVASTILGIALTVLGVFMVLFSYVRRQYRPFLKKAWDDAREFFGLVPLHIPRLKFATKADLPELRALYVSKFGEDVPSLEQMEQWHEQNPKVFIK